jgi:hypothetical protein
MISFYPEWWQLCSSQCTEWWQQFEVNVLNVYEINVLNWIMFILYKKTLNLVLNCDEISVNEVL